MLLKRYTVALAISTALAFIVPLNADASSSRTSTTAVSIGDVSYYRSENYSDSMRFAHALSSHYNRPILTSEVVRLKANFDFGFGDISMMYTIADYAGLPIDDIVVLRRKNMGWGEIAKLQGIKVQELKRRHDIFIDDAHGNGLDINYIDIDDYDRHRGDYRENDRGKDRNNDGHYDHDRDKDRNNNASYEHDRNQDKNNDKQHQDNGAKKVNKKVNGHNKDKDNGHKY